MIIINSVALAQFFEATCTNIFKRFFIAESTEDGLFGLVSTSFGMVETNSQGILHLHFFI